MGKTGLDKQEDDIASRPGLIDDFQDLMYDYDLIEDDFQMGNDSYFDEGEDEEDEDEEEEFEMHESYGLNNI